MEKIQNLDHMWVSITNLCISSSEISEWKIGEVIHGDQSGLGDATFFCEQFFVS